MTQLAAAFGEVRRVRAPLARSGALMGGDPRVLEEQRD